MSSFQFDPIAIIRTCFSEKFSIPKQSGLVPSATGVIEFFPDHRYAHSIRGLESFSHLWIIFVFHSQKSQTHWKPLIRPPQQSTEKVGVLASRSPHRPNPIGLSCVKLEKVKYEGKNPPRLFVSGVDLLDQTPILDIKPYISHFDSIDAANLGWIDPPIKTPIIFSDLAQSQLQSLALAQFSEHRTLITEVLQLDPRPKAHRLKSNQQQYGSFIDKYNIRWTPTAQGIQIDEISLR